MQQIVINSGTISRSQSDLLCQKHRLNYGQHRATNSRGNAFDVSGLFNAPAERANNFTARFI
ncbi:hypothetical protein [Microcoleus sp. Pol12B4]|uniref:hypothetical protein n=1 Tax=Microcoleus sp. Pol12B4 TaxID=3055395 RepID=UPI002FD3CAAA